MVLSCGERKGVKIFHTAGLNLTLYSAGSHWESGTFLSRSSLWDSPLTLQSLDTHFPHSSGQKYRMFLGVLATAVCCSCSTLKDLLGEGKATKRKEGQKAEGNSEVCPHLCSHFSRFWLLSTIRLLLSYISVFKLLYFAQNFQSVREMGYMWMELLCHANNKTSKKVHKFHIEKLLSFHQEFWFF